MSFGLLFDWAVRLVPAVTLFSAVVALDGDIRWIGLLGVVPLAFAFAKGCPGCRVRHLRNGGAQSEWPTFAGH